MARSNQLDFLKKQNFDAEQTSNITKAFGRSLIESIENQIASKKFSFSIDNVTIAGEGFCAVKVRYLDTVMEKLNGEEVPRLQISNKVIGIKTLG